MPTDEAFRELLTRARQGDEQALADLVRRYEGRVRLTARVLLGPALRPHLDSVDLTQSVHRTLLVGLRDEKFDFDTPEQLLALLLTVVRRKVARHWRKAQRQQRLDSQSGEIDAVQLLASLAQPQENPAASAQLEDSLRHVLDQMTSLDRRVIELRLLGHSTVEVAEQLGQDARVLRARLSRLRQKLREQGVLGERL